MIRFLHAADLHLDSPLRDLEKYEGAPVDRIRGASRRALENLVKLAIDERVAFVLLAGDIYDGDWQDVSTGLFFVGEMAKLRAAGIPVFLIAGNHDAVNKMSRKLPYPDNVRIFPHERSATMTLDEVGIAVHGQSYAERAETRNLAIGYPAAIKGMVNIGLLHTALSGRDGHEPYAPCSIEDLLTREYDYWALGHVHQRESVRSDDRACIELPGNLQGRNIREWGAKGCLLATVNEQRQISTEFVSLDVVRWSRIQVNCLGLSDRDEIFRRVSDGLEEAVADATGRMLAARLELIGPCVLHDSLLAEVGMLRDEFRAISRNFGDDAVWLEKVHVRTTAPTAATPRDEIGDDALSEITEVAADLANQPEQLRVIFESAKIKTLASKIPAELKDGVDAILFDDPTWTATLLDRARALLVQEATRKEAGR